MTVILDAPEYVTWTQKLLSWTPLANTRWYRQWVGGRWELWYNDVTHSDFWCHEPIYDRFDGAAPACCLGGPQAREIHARFPKAQVQSRSWRAQLPAKPITRYTDYGGVWLVYPPSDALRASCRICGARPGEPCDPGQHG